MASDFTVPWQFFLKDNKLVFRYGANSLSKKLLESIEMSSQNIAVGMLDQESPLVSIS
jgi:hypothetical protein